MNFSTFFSLVQDAQLPSIDRPAAIGNNEAVQTDAHLHLLDLAERDSGFFSRLPDPDWCGAVVSHGIEEFESSELLRGRLPPTVAGFGIHPQAIRWDTADYLCALVDNRKITFIGEVGFEFFGDRPERVRNDENLKKQREAFEFQLSLAVNKGLPLLVHSRKGTDVLMGYGATLRRLPALIFHGWPGRIHDARAFLEKGVPAYFSFGTTLLMAAKHAVETCAGLPEERILSETDAPWQPPRGEEWTGLGHIAAVTGAIARIRGLETEAMARRLRENFDAAFGRGA